MILLSNHISSKDIPINLDEVLYDFLVHTSRGGWVCTCTSSPYSWFPCSTPPRPWRTCPRCWPPSQSSCADSSVEEGAWSSFENNKCLRSCQTKRSVLVPRIYTHFTLVNSRTRSIMRSMQSRGVVVPQVFRIILRFAIKRELSDNT